MSVREEDRQKNSCPSRGLGIAAAAIGVGVGAALYYFFNKRQENPSTEGSSSEWTHERQQTFGTSQSDDSYTTVSEHETSDTSMNPSSEESFTMFDDEASVVTVHTSSEPESDGEEDDVTMDSDMESEIEEPVAINFVDLTSAWTSDSESESTEWDTTTITTGVRNLFGWYHVIDTLESDTLTSDNNRRHIRTTQDELRAIKRQEAFRERSWTLEECSICFDVMLRNQEVTSLPCSHNFHTECIMPWLQEKQTCPNCRKVAE